MSDKNTEYQKKIREKRKSEGKKTLQIPANQQTIAELNSFKQKFGLKSQEQALVTLLNEHERYEKLKAERQEPPTFKQWWSSIFSRVAAGNK
jgi:hypothetical protein|tara:strand:+ start:1385 stop:1660 length:276 start_codon:yes stop_codon:yes gene_type:complete